ncbi:MAG: sigma-70 family RNA polymerase sigma factor [Planctomycetes bacterium]|jgi:RNA polymerase sigma-70 factor (ECF subfamily)|nr:sigma-70 family RNA polymerase sigma factor [Planctomycetota bacterium]
MAKDNFVNDSNPEELFFQLFITHQQSLYAYILASVHNFSDADDILQETAAIMWRRFSEFEQGTSFIAWGIGIARILILKHFSERKRSRLQFDDDLVKQLADLTVQEIDPNRNCALKNAFRECFERLSESHRDILQLRYQHGMKIKDIANHTHRSAHGMYKVISRIHDALQHCIEGVLRRSGGEFNG